MQWKTITWNFPINEHLGKSDCNMLVCYIASENDLDKGNASVLYLNKAIDEGQVNKAR